MLSMPILNGRIRKWILALSEFDLRFKSAKAVKGQVCNTPGVRLAFGTCIAGA
jgi:hypothetical protein